MAKKGKTPKEKAIDAALALAADKGWDKVTLPAVARKAGLKLAELHDLFDDRFDIITAWGRQIDRRVLESAATPDATLSPRERLFDILMERIDVVSEHRDGARAILKALKTDPKHAIIALPHLCRSMSWMLEACGIETAGTKGVLRIAGLNIVYLKTLMAWCDDDSDDFAKTMAALDKNLNRAEQLAESLGIA